jgi:uncharacterized membrane protein
VAYQRSTRRTLGLLGSLVLIGLIVALPDIAPRIDTGSGPVEAFHGRIETIAPAPTTSDPGVPPVPVAHVLMLEGPQAGKTIEAYLSGPGGSQSNASYRPGDDVVVTITQTPDQAEPFIAVSDRWRLPGLGWLAILFAVAVIVVGGWHGVRALIALGLTIVVILKILLPLVIIGVPPVPLAVIGATGITIVTILLTEGWRRSSLAAILGTAGALALTGLLAAAATSILGFTYTAGSDLAFLATPDGYGLDLRGVLLAAIILGAVGVLDDVTITQAVLVDELSEAGGLEGTGLVVSAMRIGRSHIAATVNTLFLAYLGVGLPLLVLLIVSRQPLGLVLNDETIATEIVRTLAGSLGIVAAIPLTTFIAASLVDKTGAPATAGWESRTRASPRRAIGAAVIVTGLLVLTAILPLGTGAREPMQVDTFDPGFLGSPGPGASGLGAGGGDGTTASDAPTSSDGPGSSYGTGFAGGQTLVVERDEPVPLVVDGKEVGQVTVDDWSMTPSTSPAPSGAAPSAAGASAAPSTTSTETLRATVHYAATDDLPLSSSYWAILLADGTELPLAPVGDPGVLDGTLSAGQQLDVDLVGDVDGAPSEVYLVLVDRATDELVFALVVR